MLTPHPAHVGRYAIRHEVGRGGHARVYEAWDDAHNRRVAVKILDVDLAPSEALKAVRKEIHTMGLFDGNPRIVTVYDHGLHEGLPFIVTTFYPSGSVAQLVSAAGPATIDQVVQCASDVALALEDLHRHDVVHRDIKPGNIFVSGYGFALGDFGISLQSTDSDTTTRRREMTVAYAPPEAIHDRAASPAGDLYSLGATLYFMLAGEKPFRASNEGALIREICETAPPPILRADAPSELVELVESLLSKHPTERPTATKVIQRMARIGGSGAPPAARVDAPLRRLEEPDPTRVAASSSSRRWLLPVSVAIGAAVVAFGAGQLLTAGSGSDDEAPSRTTSPLGGDPLPPDVAQLEAVLDGDRVRLTWAASDTAAAYRVDRSDGARGRSLVTTTQEPEAEVRLSALEVEQSVSGEVCFVVRASSITSVLGNESNEACVELDP